ncbi:glycine betaine uptake BCCT transporter [Tenuibacillus multivorans]|uniref:Glycine betaine transporter n=1 Tax=Tenuibacillus multivorans TaxID=237069 RepID=A0A1G9YCX7_9BACI|nr:BCCT family transporter [Tenuibacillus multivorans]GEL76031.1 glycine/betaine ABC transporter [Tenuibacillus multivorans]SDN06486.1 glycine betaine transporter [Tenuibacillus multivorans]
MQDKVTKVFYISLAIAILFIIWGTISENILPNWNLGQVTGNIQNFLVSKFGWFYLLSATSFLVFAIFLIVSKYGNIVLGKDGDEPEYNYLTWFGMLFSAGMGIGLVFWGAAEPISHYNTPPFQVGSDSEAAKVAMRYSFFHWGLHPWAIYSVLALALAYFQFRKDSPGLISSTLKPLFGDRMDGGYGTLVNVIAVFATIFGVATSLGLGAQQISSGLGFIFDGLTNNFTLQFIIIIVVTILFMISAISGLDRGIKYLSTTNICLAILLLIFMLFAGPTNFIMNFFTTTLGTYIQKLPAMSFRMAPFSEENTGWLKDWTIFYWAWWIAWAPFVGMFIARVSRGRTVREFVVGVLLVPTIFGALWFAVFGGSAIALEYNEGLNLFSVIEDIGTEAALFTVFENYQFTTITSILTIFLISTFFITSADSATFVLGMQTTGGSLDPALRVKIAWGIVQSATAAVLLWQGGLGALQTASIIAAFPFAFILIMIIFSIIKEFKEEGRNYPLKRKKREEG